MNWHYVDQGQQAGPVTDDQLLQLFQSGKITADTLVWREGLPDWITYHQASPELVSTSPPLLRTPAATPPTGAVNPTEVICAECGKVFPVSETIRISNANVCAACKPVFLQKLSEGARLNTGEMNYAGFGIRFAAKLLDWLILGVPFAICYIALLFPLFKAGVSSQGQGPPPALILWSYALQFGFLFVRIAYDTFFIGKYGATPGKMVCKIKVVTAEGEKVTFGRATGRAFSELLSGMICYIGYIMVAFDEQKRGLHDHICNTRVIYK
jgi:uncharacterized RDD family membrane protein YckC